MYSQRGFTLIELMVVVAIVSILAAMALPAFSTYQAKSKLTAGLAEVAGAKSAVEDIVNNGGNITSPSQVGLISPSKNCIFTVNNTQIQCMIINAPQSIDGATVAMIRTGAGIWSCLYSSGSNLGDRLTPKGCSLMPN